MRFSWDNEKDLSNQEKHGICFETAKKVFDDPYQLSVPDSRYAEDRWQTLGTVGGVLLLVAHTWDDDEEEEHIRIISARKATRGERERYENDSI